MQYPNHSQSPPSGQNMAASQPISTRQQIIDSLFSKIGPDGQREETLITHLKVWEDGAPDMVVGPTDIDGRKIRYLLLAGEYVFRMRMSSGPDYRFPRSKQNRPSLPS